MVLAVSFSLPQRSSGAASPEYIASEEPIPATLEDSTSATDDVGVVPEPRSVGRRFPMRALPRLREKVPKTGHPFLDDTTFHVAPRAYYRLLDNADGSKSEALALGGRFGVTSGYLAKSFRVSISGYTSQKLYGPSDRDGTGLLQRDQQSYTVFGEVNADLRFKRSFLTLGWQRIDTPYINSQDSRMTPNTFEGIVLRSTELENLQAGFGHISRMRFRNSSDFEHMSERAGANGSEQGVSSFGLRYNFSERFYFSILDQFGWDTFNTIYTETEHFFPLSDHLSLKFGVQFTDQRSVGDELTGDFDTQSLGAKGSLGYHSLIASTSVTWTSKEAGVRTPWGGSPNYNSVMISDFDRSGEKSIRTGLSYDFSKIGLKNFATSASWLYGDTPDSGSAASPDQQEFDVNFDYRPPVHGLENFWLRIRYALNDRDDIPVRDDLRVILNYSFLF